MADFFNTEVHKEYTKRTEKKEAFGIVDINKTLNSNSAFFAPPLHLCVKIHGRLFYRRGF